MGYEQIAIENKPFVLQKIIERYLGGRVSFEGDFDINVFNEFEQIEYKPDDVHIRNTIYPVQDYVCFPLSNKNIELMKRIISNIGIKNSIMHILISIDNRIIFAAYDNFHPKCISFTDEFDRNLLDEFNAKGFVHRK